MKQDDAASVTLRRFDTEGEAQAAAAFLRAHEIPCHLVYDRLGGAIPVPGAATGLRLRVPGDREQEARELLASVAIDAPDETDEYAGRTEENDPTIARGLEELRNLQRQSWTPLLAFVPAALLAVVWRPGVVLAVGLVAYNAWIGLRTFFAECPRCGRPFFRGRWGLQGGTRCRHCGLPLHPPGGA